MEGYGQLSVLTLLASTAVVTMRGRFQTYSFSEQVIHENSVESRVPVEAFCTA
jgi:hypothetical protein